MHETHLANDLITKALTIADQASPGRVEGMRIEIGALNHATPESLEATLVDAADHTSLSGIVFDITKSDNETARDALDVRLVSMTIGEE